MQVNAKELNECIRKVYIPNKTSNSILGSLLMESVDGKLVLSSTNLDIKNRLETNINWSSTIAIDKKAIDVISKVGDQEIEIEEEDTTLIIKFDNSTFKTATIDTTDLIGMVKVDTTIDATEINSSQLLKAISKASGYVATDDTRYVFNGLYLSNGIVAATDGRRLLRYKTNIELSNSCIIPYEAIPTIKSILENSDTIKLSIGETLQITDGKFTMQTKLIDGNYPDIENVIPKEAPTKFTISKDKIKSSLNIALGIAETPSRQLIFEGKYGKLTMSCKDSSGSLYSVELGDTQEEFKLALKGDYFKDAIISMDDNEISVKFFTPNSPCKFGDVEHIDIVVMPMKISD